MAKKHELEVTYRSEKSTKDNTWYLQITSGEYTGCVFKYTEWRFVRTVNDLDGSAKYHLQFKFSLLHSPDKWNEPDGVMLDTTNKSLMALLGNILLDLQVDEFEKAKQGTDGLKDQKLDQLLQEW